MLRTSAGRAVAAVLVLVLAVAATALVATSGSAAPAGTTAADEPAPTSTSPTATADPTETTSPTDAPSETPTDDPTPTPTPTAPTPTPTDDPTSGPFTVDDAQLRWGVNDESNNAAFAPGTFNFFSAGEVRDPGAGGQRLPLRSGGATWSNGKPARWSARAGEVRIEKRRPDGSYALAAFDGTSTDVAGSRLTTGGGSFSDHQVVIDGGTGTVDPAAGRATVSWKGTFTVLYYSGMTFFTVSDPQLVVTPTTARLSGTLGGYASDMNDTSTWVKVPGRRVVLADLPRAGLRLPTTGGITGTPSYLRVRHDAPSAGVTQVRTGPSWGAFPASFLTAMHRLGSAAYWYSSGGSADAHKVPLPLTVSYSAGSPVTAPVDPQPTAEPTAEPTQPSAPVAPAPPAPLPPAGPGLPAQAPAVLPPGAAPAGATPPIFDPRLPAVPVVNAQTLPAASRATSSGHPWEWWTGSLLLLGAAALTILGNVSSRVKGKS
ncbi:hypothetical protein [Nocardioides lijunqiniae]|uniref:hypothetical protein n=1 Tax=Nocardioides lijunqiniae TaxID=2760832 RepID=UPI00187802D9|nr:hypothetical protein [Nocardioides lijunqiniae]